MATSTVTYIFTNGTTADASEVDQNFTDLTNFLNTQVVHADGSVAMSGNLVLPGVPSSANHAASKQYVDNGAPQHQILGLDLATVVSSTPSVLHAFDSQQLTIPNPGRRVSIGVIFGATVTGTAAREVRLNCQYSLDGGTTWVTMPYTARVTTVIGSYVNVVVPTWVEGITPTANLVVRPVYFQVGGSANDVTFTDSNLWVEMKPV